MKLSILAVLLFSGLSAFANTSCNLEKAEMAWEKYAPIFEQMNGLNAWGYGIACTSGAPACLQINTETAEQLEKIKAAFPAGIILDGCTVEFSFGQIARR